MRNLADLAGNGNDVVVAETGDVIGIPIHRSPGANDRPSGVVLAQLMIR